MTPELYPPAPRVLQWVPCPVCNMLFKDPQGRGGHLRHTRDPAHTAYRAQHGLAKAKHSLYPAEIATQAPPRAPAPAVPPPEPEVWVLDEPAELRPLIEDDAPDEIAPESPTTSPALEAPSPAPPASPVRSPASPAQAVRLASPEAVNGHGELSEAGEAPKQGDSNAPRQAPASAPQAAASPSPTPRAPPAYPALGASSSPALPPPSPSSPVKVPVSPSPPPASPAQVRRLALPEAPIRYGESREEGEAGRQTASIGARRPEAGAPAHAPGAPALPVKAPGVDWSDPKNARAGLRVVGGALMRPPTQMHWVGRVICVGIALVIVGWPLWELIQQLKAPNRPAEPHVIDASKLTAGPPSRKTGDPYWDHLLGYGGQP